MRLTQFSDYSLRVLLYLGVHNDRLVPVAEIAQAYGISYHHLGKVVVQLRTLGLVESSRGRSGGLRLIAAPGDVPIGWVVRRTEPDLHLVECFDKETDTCPITPACKLKHVLADARDRFLEVLDGQTLADLLSSPQRQGTLVQLWAAKAEAST